MEKKWYKTWWGILMILLFIGIVIYYIFGLSKSEKDADTNIKNEVVNILPPAYLLQMDKCENFGGIVEKQSVNIDTWEEISSWKCICDEGEIFDKENYLSCNEWYSPQN